MTSLPPRRRSNPAWLAVATLILLLAPVIARTAAAPSRAEDGPVTAAKFTRRAMLPHWQLPFCPSFGSPWSPAGSLLAVTNGEALAVFDARHPETAPRVVLRIPRAGDILVAWSPDGDWLACECTRMRVEGDPKRGWSRSLWAVPAAVGDPQVVEWNHDLWSFAWASTGALIAWDAKGVRTLDPPAAWKAAHPQARSRTPFLTFLPKHGVLSVVPGKPGEAPAVTPAHGLDAALARERFPGGGRFLLTRLGQPSRNLVLDAQGEILGDLDAPVRTDPQHEPDGFTATSVCADGHTIAGSYERPRHRDGSSAAGDVVHDTWLVFLTDTLGTARVPVSGAGLGIEPHCAPVGRDVALRLPDGGIEVGVLTLRH